MKKIIYCAVVFSALSLSTAMAAPLNVSNPEHFTPHVRVKETSIPENWKP